mgnify:CR=1 FL=1|jgi:hypothetical protein
MNDTTMNLEIARMYRLEDDIRRLQYGIDRGDYSGSPAQRRTLRTLLLELKQMRSKISRCEDYSRRAAVGPDPGDEF